MTKEEMTLALKEFKETLPTYLTEDDLNKSIEAMTSKLEGLDMSEEIKDLKEIAEAQGVAMKEMQTKATSKEVKTIADYLEENAEAIKNAHEKTVTIKTDITRASITDSAIALRLTDVGQLPTQSNRLAPLFNQATIGNGMGGVVRYIDQLAITNNAAAVAEGAVKPESDFTWQEYTMPLQKVAHNVPVSMEALQDVGFMQSEINNLLLKYLDIKVDNYLWSGTGTAPQIKGVFTAATAYTPVASGITDASIYDLIVKLQEAIMADSGYVPNYAIMNIADVNKMKLKKDANNNYVLPPFASQDGQNVSGFTVIASNSVTANTMLVGDFTMATLYKMGGVTIKVGMIDKQFVENMVTIQAEQRVGLLVRNAHAKAFYKVGSISGALTTLAS